MRYILLNFAYGYGPFLRTTELALSVKKLLEQKTDKKYGIIVPLVYGEKQKQIMKEAFNGFFENNQEEIVFDENLGHLIEHFFYGAKSYLKALEPLTIYGKEISVAIKKYLTNGLNVQTVEKKEIHIKPDQITMCINRSPRIGFGVEPSYDVTFALISDILEQAINETQLSFNHGIITNALPYLKEIEESHDIIFISEPATFSFNPSHYSHTSNNIQLTPPAIAPLESFDKIKPGIFVTITGIPNLDRLYTDARRLGLNLYSNKPEVVPGSVSASPKILASNLIQLHFARAGWGSIWSSMHTNTPFITPAYDRNDDPEIYFNNLTIEKLGLGKIYREEALEELTEQTENYKHKVDKIKQDLFAKYKTLDGINYTAEKITEHYLNNYQ